MDQTNEKKLETIIQINLNQRFLKEDAIILAKEREEIKPGWCFYLYCLGFVTMIVALFYYSDNR